MGLCWPIQMQPTCKAVLMSLADQANDQGFCWPSIAGIAERTCFGRTAVIEALKWLEAAGFATVEKSGGRTNRYTLNLGKLKQREIEPVRQPDQSAKRTSPPNEPPPVRQADEPVRQPDPNRKEPSSKRKEKREAPPMASLAELVAAGFDEPTAAEFIVHKAAVKAPLTRRAWADHLSESAKAGWTPQQAAEKVMAKAWKGFEAKYVAGQQSGAVQALTFRQRDELHAIERVREMTGGLAAAKPTTARTEAAPLEVFDATRRLG